MFEGVAEGGVEAVEVAEEDGRETVAAEEEGEVTALEGGEVVVLGDVGEVGEDG